MVRGLMVRGLMVREYLTFFNSFLMKSCPKSFFCNIYFLYFCMIFVREMNV